MGVVRHQLRPVPDLSSTQTAVRRFSLISGAIMVTFSAASVWAVFALD
jgi:hypothetical protein